MKCGYCGKIVWPWQVKTDYYVAISSFKHGEFYLPQRSHYACWFKAMRIHYKKHWEAEIEKAIVSVRRSNKTPIDRESQGV